MGGLLENNNPTSCVLVFLMAQLMLWFCPPPGPGASAPPFISKRGEVTKKVTELVII
jgi:hypothetical protein